MKNILKNIALTTVFLSVVGAFAAIGYWLQASDDEARLSKLLFDEHKKIAQAFFSPDNDVRDLLISLINLEKKSISVAIYTLTDKKIADALLRAARRGVSVECVVDRAYGTDRHSKVHQLANAQIPVWVYRSALEERAASLMHNKFCIFEDSVEHRALVWTGSYNFTMRANDRNQENVVVLDNPAVVEKFRKQFAVLKKRSVQISGEIQNPIKSDPDAESSWIKKLIG